MEQHYGAPMQRRGYQVITKKAKSTQSRGRDGWSRKRIAGRRWSSLWRKLGDNKYYRAYTKYFELGAFAYPRE